MIVTIFTITTITTTDQIIVVTTITTFCPIFKESLFVFTTNSRRSRTKTMSPSVCSFRLNYFIYSGSLWDNICLLSKYIINICLLVSFVGSIAQMAQNAHCYFSFVFRHLIQTRNGKSLHKMLCTI
jgi:hypothetical protein